MLTLGTRTARADVIWVEQTQQHMHAKVGPWEWEKREQALCEFLGVDWDSLSSQVKNSILTEDNGSNAFTTLLAKTLNMQYEYYRENPAVGGDSVIGNVVGSVQQTTYNVWCTLFGEDNIWDIDCTNTEFENAKTLIYKYMYPREEEEEEPGTGTSSTFEDSVNMTYTGYGTKVTDKTTNQKIESFILNIDDSAVTTLNNWMSSNNCNKYIIVATFLNGTKQGIHFYIAPDDIELTMEDGYLYATNTGNGSSYIYKRNVTLLTVNNGIGDISTVGNSSRVTISSKSILESAYVVYTNESSGGGGGGGGGDPYVPTPDPEPEPPTPPRPPIGPTGTGDEYTHNDYDVDITVDFPEYNEYGGNLDLTWTINFTANTGVGQNVEDILNLILEEIRDFRRDVYDYWHQLCENMEAISNAIQQTIDWQIGELQTALGTLDTDIVTQLQENKRSINDTMSNRLQWLNDNIVTAINEGVGEILGEIYQDAMYIADSLNFSAEFDDKNIVTWLKKIYTRLGSKPVIKNPTEDPKGWFDDLKKLLETILETALAGVDTAALATLWNTAKSHFPLSLPWDMLAIVGLLAHEPVTPAVDYPIVFNGETIAEIEIDLSDYEDVADVSRKMSVIVFAMGLLITYPQVFHTLEPLTKALRG